MQPLLTLAQVVHPDTVGRIAEGGTQGLIIALCVACAALATALVYVVRGREADARAHAVELLRLYNEQHARERETGALAERLSAAVDTLEALRSDSTGRHNARK